MTDPNQSASGEMPLISHLVELRNRLLRVVAVVLVIFLCLFYFANDLYHYVSAPLRDMLPPGSSMIATEVASTFLAPLVGLRQGHLSDAHGDGTLPVLLRCLN